MAMTNTPRQWMSLLLGLLLLLQSMLGVASIGIDADDAAVVADAAVDTPPCHGGTDPVPVEPEPCPCCDQMDCSDMASCLGASAVLNYVPSDLVCTRGQAQVPGATAALLSLRLTPLLRPPIHRSA